MTDQQEQSGSDQEGEPEIGEVDPELMALAEERASSSALRPILFLAVIGLSIWIVSDFWGEIEYFFSPAEPVEVGEVTELASEPGEDPDWSEHFPHNRYVSLRGIPKRRSQSEKYRYFKLVGAPIYVEAPLEEGEDRSTPVAPRRGAMNPTDREYFEGAGRLIAFEKMPERYNGVKRYYRQKYGTRFCETLDEGDRERIRNEKRTAIVDNWRERYEEASDQKRKRDGLTPEPSDQKVDEILEANPICVEAYLLRSTVEPSDNWTYLLVAGLFGLFMLLNVYWLVRWMRDFFRSDVDVNDLGEGGR